MLRSKIAARDRFFRAYQESGFLFSKGSGIEEILKKLNEKGTMVIGLKELRGQFKGDPVSIIKNMQQINDIQLNDFPDGLAQLKDAMSKYMNFHEL
jgi:hypothetical protein